MSEEITFLSLHDILDRALAQDDLHIPEWDGWVKVRAITAAELSECQRASTNRNTGEVDGVKVNLLVVEKGMLEPKLAPGQYKVLQNKEMGPLSVIANRILELSGMGDETEDDQGEA